MYVNHDNRYPLPPGGNVTIHFSQLVVADVIIIYRYGALTLCEVDVLGTRVVFALEGQFTYTLKKAPTSVICIFDG